MTIEERLAALTLEQQDQFAAVTSEQELDAALAEAGLEPTQQEKDLLLAHITGRIDDDHLEGAAGGITLFPLPKVCPNCQVWLSSLVPPEQCPRCGQVL